MLSCIFLRIFVIILLLRLSCAFPTKQWLPPFNNPERLSSVCTDNNHEEVMQGEESTLVREMAFIAPLASLFVKLIIAFF